MQAATPATVLGDFDGATFAEDGFTSRFSRRADRFFVNTLGGDGQPHDYEIRFTFGVAPLQQYLVEFPGGRLQPLTLAWDTRGPEQGGGRWFALDAVAPQGTNDDLHWTGRGMNWNFMCADCHATGVRKGYVAAPDTFDTRYAELGVGCEGCHGPGAEHVRRSAWPSWVRSVRWKDNGLPARLNERRAVTWSIDSASGNARRSRARTSDREINVCAQCHALRVHLADGYTAGAPLMDYYDPFVLLPSLYYADGQQRDEVYNHGSFLQSRMYAVGVTCADCHDPHSQKLRRTASQVCAQCHRAAKYDSTAHHGHARGSAGSECAACHMPVTTYLEIDGRHDHSIRVPRPDRSAQLGVPDACAGCHAGRGAAWAAGAIRQWGGKALLGFQHFADTFAADEGSAPDAPAQLVALARDGSQPAIVRASALARLARYPSAAAREAAAQGSRDPDPLVRRAALDALTGESAARRVAIAAPLLGDSLRAVRQQAAWLLAAVADSLPTARLRAAFERASDEFVSSQRYNADRADHRVTLGAFFLARGDTAAGTEEFRAALRQWPGYVPAVANLAGVLSLQGREVEGEQLLRDALVRAPNEAELHHELGLSLARQGRIPEALAEVAMAAKLSPGEKRYLRTSAALREVRTR